MFQLTSFWTSGKLKGLYHDDKGTWESTQAPLQFPNGTNFLWVHRQYPVLSQIREGVNKDACVETTFESINLTARFRPDYCDIPKYFLMYRISKSRGDPAAMNHLGITVVETGPREIDTRIINPIPRRPANAALVSSITKSSVSNKTNETKKREVIPDKKILASYVVNDSAVEVKESESVSGSSSSEGDYDIDLSDDYDSTTKPSYVKENSASDSSKSKADKQKITSILKRNSIIAKSDASGSESVSGSSSSSEEEVKKDVKEDKTIL